MVFWASHVETGRWMPVDAAPAERGGNLALYKRGDALIIKGYDSEARRANVTPRVSHFVTCPDGDRWRKTR
jgi:hypothetical protein